MERRFEDQSIKLGWLDLRCTSISVSTLMLPRLPRDSRDSYLRFFQILELEWTWPICIFCFWRTHGWPPQSQSIRDRRQRDDRRYAATHSWSEELSKSKMTRGSKHLEGFPCLRQQRKSNGSFSSLWDCCLIVYPILFSPEVIKLALRIQSDGFFRRANWDNMIFPIKRVRC